MCRLTLYLGPEIALSKLFTEPSHSVLDQSRASRERAQPTNGDGFGVAWYAAEQPEDPARFRSVTPAWNDPNLRDLARVQRSECLLAHVRSATQATSVSIDNCHPFRSGRYVFMHNGDVGGFRFLRRALLASLSDEAFQGIRGGTDSEHALALLVDELAKDGDLPAAMERTIARIVAFSREHGREDDECYLNFAVADGRRAVVTRFTTREGHDGESLYLNHGRRYECLGGVCRMVEPGDEGPAVVVSSEPLSDDPGWVRVPRSSMVVAERAEGRTEVEVRPLLA